MPKFFTRVELHGKYDYQSYQNLHKEMATLGFERTILSDNGKSYHLLTAEYVISTTYSTNDVVNFAKTAASKVDSNYSVFVVEYTIAQWYNLKEV